VGLTSRIRGNQGFLSSSPRGTWTSSEAFLTQGYSYLSSVLPEFTPLTPWSSNFSEIVVSRELVEVFSTVSNRPDEVILRFERVISPCISRFSSKERGDMQCAKAAGSLRPRGHLWSPSSEMYHFKRIRDAESTQNCPTGVSVQGRQYYNPSSRYTERVACSQSELDSG